MISPARKTNPCTDEEKHLISFFGDDYVTYREKTWVGIPFIK